MIGAVVAVLAGVALAPNADPNSQEPPRSVRIGLQMLEQQGPRMPLAAYELLEASGHEQANQALIETASDPLLPLLLRARCARHLSGFASEAELAEPTREALFALALDAPEPGLRLLAVHELAEFGASSRPFLEGVVDHSDDPVARARALGHHADLAPDPEWYVALLTGIGREERSDRFDRDVVLVGAPLRAAAFDELVDSLDAEVLAVLTDARDMELRLDSLRELARREDEGIDDRTLERWNDPARSTRERLVAGALHLPYSDKGFVEELIEAAAADEVDRTTREEVGRAVGEALTIRLTSSLHRSVARGKLGERAVAASALRGDTSLKFRKNLVKLLKDEDPGLRALAAEELGAWEGEDEVLRELLKRLEDGPELGDGEGLVRAVARVAAGREDLAATLGGLVEHEAADVRATALVELMLLLGPEGGVPTAKSALSSDDWPQVDAAVGQLIAWRTPAAIEALIEVLPTLEGRDRRAVSEGLWRVSGLQLGMRAEPWQGWWEQVAESFEPLDERETALILEERRLEEELGGTSATFFGVRVESRRVCFILDCSGSMKELTSWGRTGREDGGVTRDTRLDVAKAEFTAALDSLPPGTLFNVIAFSDDAEVWSSKLQPADVPSIRKAKTFVDNQKARGGTNLYAALSAAFSDQRLDAIVLLSDGEPSMGELRDPDEILDAIERWNGGRGVRMDCVAIGVQLALLEDLAQACFGECVRIL